MIKTIIKHIITLSFKFLLVCVTIGFIVNGIGLYKMYTYKKILLDQMYVRGDEKITLNFPEYSCCEELDECVNARGRHKTK